MRIQHNIMAMNAYRNYTNNVSAMQKNLEKLSSGYKINRAGDDAAGLAISEKMRAQISGLEAAQKNAKDGISLVQTAEGALTEVHDMLNRMVTLATQSANGTYADTTDREQLQKEVSQLLDEINRIADSSNFNGIKLLDGSMDAGGDTVVTEGQFVVPKSGTTAGTNSITLPTVGKTLGTNTVLHEEAAEGSDETKFSVELHNLEFSNAAGATLTLKIGTDEFTLDGADADALTADKIAEAFVDGTFKDSAGTAVDDEKVSIGGKEYTVTAEGGKLTFTANDDQEVAAADIPQTVAITGDDGTGTPAATATKAKIEITAPISGGDPTWAENDTVTAAVAAGAGDNGQATFTLVAKMDDEGKWNVSGAPTGYAATFDGTKFTLEATAEGKKDIETADFGAVTLTFSEAAGTAGLAAGTSALTFTDGAAAGEATAGGSAITGDYNVSTTDITFKAEATDKRLASTKFTLTADMVKDGSTLTIGKDTYTFTTDKDKIGEDGYVDATSGDLKTIAENLTKAAADNATYTVGTNATAGSISITEVDGQKNFDLTTMKGIEKSLGFTKASTTTKDDTKGLTLQIGDTADPFNQLKVSIKDMHDVSLKIDDVDISTQDGAITAIDKIKNAINMVSDVRGTLGATQNRLDHTINNLSVMTENIQDAESTIRDVDVAEEMMAYTKNSILIQSAQAMLAQANQIPQGVLQLLG